jgi:tetratricopeptide (TPR) repeat protein
MSFDKRRAVQNALLYTQQGKWDRAIAEYQAVLKADPADLTVCNNLGDLYARAGRLAEAIEQYRKLGESYRTDGLSVKAIAVYKKIAKLDPAWTEAYTACGDLYVEQGLVGEAKLQFATAAQLYAKAGETGRVVEIYQRLAQLDPSNLSLLTKLAELLAKQGSPAAAAEEYTRAAQAAEAAGHPADAARLLQRARELAPPPPPSAARAEALLAEGKVEGAREVLTRLLEDPAAKPAAWRLLAEVEAARDEPEEALRLLEQAVARGVRDEEVADLRNRLLVRLGWSPVGQAAVASTPEQAAAPADQPATAAAAPSAALVAEPQPDLGEFELLLEDEPALLEVGPAAAGAAEDGLDAHVVPTLLPRELAEEETAEEPVVVLPLEDEREPAGFAPDPATAAGTMEALAGLPSAAGERALPVQELPELEAETPGASLLEPADEPETEGPRVPVLELPADEPETEEDRVPVLELPADEPETEDRVPVVELPVAEPETDPTGFPVLELPVGEPGMEASRVSLPDLPVGEPDTHTPGFPLLEAPLEEPEIAAARFPVLEPPPEKPETYTPGPVEAAAEEAEIGRTSAPVRAHPAEGPSTDAPRRPAARGLPAEQGGPAAEAGGLGAVLSEAPVHAAPSPSEIAAPAVQPGDFSLAQDESLDFLGGTATPLDEDDAPSGQAAEQLAEADVYLKYGLEDKARERLVEVVRLSPNSVTVRRKLKNLYREQQRVEQACDQIVAIAKILEERRRPEAAREEIREGLELAPGHPELRRLLEARAGAPAAGAERRARASHPGGAGLPASVELPGVGGDGVAPPAAATSADVSDPATEPPTPDAELVLPPELQALLAGPEEAGPAMDRADVEDGPAEELAEAEFYLAQGMMEEAGAAARRLRKRFPGHPAVSALLARLNSGPAAGRVEPEAEPRGEAGRGPGGESPGSEALVSGLLTELKKGVHEPVDAKDFETHYNLGIAYKEMDLFDEAIQEFELAAADPRRVLECADLLGQCHLAKGQPQLALAALGAGLAAPGSPPEAYRNLRYGLALAYEALGDDAAALEQLEQLMREDARFRDVQSRVQLLRARAPRPAPAEAEAPAPPARSAKQGKRRKISFI